MTKKNRKNINNKISAQENESISYNTLDNVNTENLTTKIKECIINFFKKITNIETIKSIFLKLNTSQRFFVIGLIFLVLSTPWFFDAKNFWIIFSLGLFSVFLGIVSDILLFSRKISETIIGKIIIIISTAFILNIGYALADQIINEIIKYDTSSIKYTTTITAIMLIPLVIPAFSIIILIFFIIASSIFPIFIAEKRIVNFIPIDENYKTISLIFRFFAYPIIFSTLMSLSTHKITQNFYEQKVISWTSSYLYHFEAKNHSRCKGIAKDSKVITVNDDEIIVVSKNQNRYQFKAQYCNPIIDQQSN